MTVKRSLNKETGLNFVYTARNATEVMQVVNFTDLSQLVNKLQKSCQFHHVTTSLLLTTCQARCQAKCQLSDEMSTDLLQLARFWLFTMTYVFLEK